jgi:hypothetical protein
MLKRIFITLIAGLTMLGTAISADYKEEMTLNLNNGFQIVSDNFMDSYYTTCNWAKIYYMKSIVDSNDNIEVMLSQVVIDKPGKLYKNHKADMYNIPLCEDDTCYIELLMFEDGMEKRIYITEGCNDIYEMKDYCVENINWKG